MEVMTNKQANRNCAPVRNCVLLAAALVIAASCGAAENTDLARDDHAAHAQDEPCPGCSSGAITRIIDGDTLDIGSVRIRLALVDSPERGDPGYEEAAAFAASLCNTGDAAFYDPDDGQPGGSHGRVIAEVFCGGKSLNAELVRGGHARILRGFCDASEFAARSWTGCAIPDPAKQVHAKPDGPIPAQSYVIPAVLAAAGLAAFTAWRRSRKPNVRSKPGNL